MWQRPSRWNRIVCSHHSLGLMYEAAEVEPIGACSERATLAGAQGQFREGKNSGGLHFRRRHEATRLGGGGNSSFRPHQFVGEEPNRATKEGGQHEGSVSNTVYSRGLDTITNVLIPYDRVACSDALQIRSDVEISSRCYGFQRGRGYTFLCCCVKLLSNATRHTPRRSCRYASEHHSWPTMS